MNLAEPKHLKELLTRHGWHPQKRWGQHFLVSGSVVSSILGRLEGIQGVLEVGPGPGVLTSPISERVQSVIAIELDPIAVSALGETAPKARVLQGNALEFDFGSIVAALPEPRAIVSNMPYNITGPLLTRFAALRDSVDRMVLMMQREVAERVMARVGTGEFGSLSIFIQSQFQVTKVVTAPAGAFMPPPKVESVVLELKSHGSMLAGVPEADFFRLVRAGFAQPRKTLLNNLVGFGITRQRASEALAELGFKESIRPHQVSIGDWKRLSTILREDG